MELVYENGQILAKVQRSNVFSSQNQRTKSIMDLYEAEYNDDFMKIIHTSDGNTINNLVETQVVPNQHVDNTVEADNKKRKNSEFIPPDEQSVVAERSIDTWTDFTKDTQGSTYRRSTSLDDDSDETTQRVPRRRSRYVARRTLTTESDNTEQRHLINKSVRAMQDLLPNSHTDDNLAMLEEVINYIPTLQNQIQMMTMHWHYSHLGPYYSQMGLPMGMGMRMGVPQFFNHPVRMPMQNPAFYVPMENYAPQVVPPSRAAPPPDQIPNSPSFPNLDDATTYTSQETKEH